MLNHADHVWTRNVPTPTQTYTGTDTLTHTFSFLFFFFFLYRNLPRSIPVSLDNAQRKVAAFCRMGAVFKIAPLWPFDPPLFVP